MVQLSLGVFCLVLMLKKRDILPKFMIIFYLGSMMVTLADNAAVSMMLTTTKVDWKEIYKSIVAVAIWVPYFSLAARVRELLLCPILMHLWNRSIQALRIMKQGVITLMQH
jgi:hypothetical protein